MKQRMSGGRISVKNTLGGSHPVQSQVVDAADGEHLPVSTTYPVEVSVRVTVPTRSSGRQPSSGAVRVSVWVSKNRTTVAWACAAPAEAATQPVTQRLRRSAEPGELRESLMRSRSCGQSAA
jgi:hypothetical protein